MLNEISLVLVISAALPTGCVDHPPLYLASPTCIVDSLFMIYSERLPRWFENFHLKSFTYFCSFQHSTSILFRFPSRVDLHPLSASLLLRVPHPGWS